MSAEWLAAWPGVLRDEPLARHSQYGVGGPADFLLRVRGVAELAELVARCAESGVPLTIIGAGSNALILDGGIRGLTVRLLDKSVALDDATATVAVSGAAMLPRVALDLAKLGVGGMEWGIGVPGTCGASVAGNAGAFGADVAGTLVECEVITPEGVTRRLETADCAFAYRDSAFRHQLASHVVVRGHFRVTREDAAAVRARTDAVQAERKRTQPYGVRSLGSTFKNPPGDFAGRLVEAAGLAGRRHGGAQISSKHANFILNVEAATAEDVLALATIARDEVAARFGVELEREIVLLGEPSVAVAAP